MSCAKTTVQDLYKPRFNWTVTKEIRKAPAALALGARGFAAELAAADLDTWPWSKCVVDVRTNHHFLLAVLCNAHVKASGLFPADTLEIQRALETCLLLPSVNVRRAVAAAVDAAGGCAVWTGGSVSSSSLSDMP